MASVDKVPTGWRARWRTPEGASRSKTFKLKKHADAHVVKMEGSKLTGSYIDPGAGKITVRTYADEWLASQTFDRSTRSGARGRLDRYVYPVLGDRQLMQVRPSTIQAWVRTLEPLAKSHQRVVFTTVASIFGAAVDDELIHRNPCIAPSVRRPKRGEHKIIPWTFAQVAAVADALPERYRIVAILGAGLGLRQGEIFGLSPGDVDFLRGTVEVRRQVKLFEERDQAFYLPKGGKTRTVPLPGAVRNELAAYLAKFPARPVTLSWNGHKTQTCTSELFVTSRWGHAVYRTGFNSRTWKPALVAAGLEPTRVNGCHALRHHYASALLDAGESIKALSSYLGHSDPGFTLRTYTHLMPASHERTQKAIDDLWSGVTDVSPEDDEDGNEQVSGGM